MIQSTTYRTWICHWCRRHLTDGETVYQEVPSLQEIRFCGQCKDLLTNPPDYLFEGTREKGTTSWRTARLLTLHRDEGKCRVCGSHWESGNKVEVHHIIPQKDGGTHNLKNLITLCERHHKETFKNGYSGLNLTDVHIQQGTQKQLVTV
jgi:5-methylcytosine-specific restriction endonuclease McrA